MICDCRCVVLLFWTLCNNGVHSLITKKPKDTEVRIGDSTYLNCSFSDTSRPKNWYHYPVGRGANDMRYVYTNEELYPPYNARFRLDTASSDGAFNLVMNQVESQDAGQYVCQNAGDPATSQLIVLESIPHCMSNIDSNGLIGPNGCGLQKETIQLSCGVSYNGNIPPKLQWTRVKNGKSFPIDDSLLSCLSSDGRITCNYTVEANIEFDGSHFNCQTNRATNTQYNCSTEAVKILYSIENKTRIAKSVGDEVSCPTANTSSSDCIYTWIWFDGELEETISKNVTLKIDREGLHRCEARCTLKDFNCKVITKSIKASTAPAGASTIDTTRCITIGFTVGISLILLSGLIVWLDRKFCRKGTKKTPSEPKVRMSLLRKIEDASEIETLKAKLTAKNNEVEDLTAAIKSKDMEIEDLGNQAARPTTSRGLLVSANIEAMGTYSDDQPSDGCDDQTKWTCKNCTFKGTGQNCEMCGHHRQRQ